MILYLFVLLFSLIYGISDYSKNGRNSKTYIFIMFMFLFFISALRNNNIGTDTVSYINTFILINSELNFASMFELNMEPLFTLLNRFTYILNNSPQTILFITSFIINLLILTVIHKRSKLPWLSIFLYISLYSYYQSFNGIRQYIAIAIIFYFYRFIEEKKPFKFLVGVMVASGFHLTALLFLPCYILNNKKFNIRVVVLSVVLVSLGFYYFDSILDLIFGNLNVYNKYDIYYNNFYSEPAGIRDIAIAFSVLLFGTFFNDKNSLNKKIGTLTYLIFIYLAISVLALKGSANLVIRVGWHFSIFIIL